MRILQLYNLFGALSEQVWWQIPAALSNTNGGDHQMVIAYETLVEGTSLPVGIEAHPLPRIPITPVLDVHKQMDDLAANPAAPTLSLGHFDLIHCHTGPRLLHAAPLLAKGTPTLISLYGYDASRLLQDPSWIQRYQWAASKGAIFAVLGEGMKNDLIAKGLPPASLHILRLGVHLPDWPYTPQPAPPIARFLFIGRLVEKKGIDTLLHAMAQLPDSHLDLIGDGPLRPQLESLAQSLKLTNITFHGPIPRHHLPEYFRQSTAFILPSRTAPDGDSEGTPIVLMESQALGTPAITTPHAGNPETLPPTAHKDFVIEPNNPTALADAMKKMILLTPTTRRSLQDAARAHIEQNYDLKLTIQSTANLYRQLTNRR